MSIMPATSTVPGRAAYAIVNLPSKNFTVRQRMELADSFHPWGFDTSLAGSLAAYPNHNTR
jgi:hypothetical protein